MKTKLPRKNSPHTGRNVENWLECVQSGGSFKVAWLLELPGGPSFRVTFGLVAPSSVRCFSEDTLSKLFVSCGSFSFVKMASASVVLAVLVIRPPDGSGAAPLALNETVMFGDIAPFLPKGQLPREPRPQRFSPPAAT